MKSISHFAIVLAVALTMVLTIQGQTAVWSLRPSSAKLAVSKGMLTFRQNGKVGLIDPQGTEVLSAAYDSISPFIDGYALAFQQMGDRLRIRAIVSDGDYEVTDVAEELFATRFTFFSEGKACVSDGARRQGFLGTDGNLAIPCIYKSVHPFSEGLASVTLQLKSNKRNVYYINSDMNEISVEPGSGEVIFGSTFSGGNAVVYTINRRGYVINRRGRKVTTYNGSVEDANAKARRSPDYSLGNTQSIGQQQVSSDMLFIHDGYTVYEQGGLYGYMRNGQVVLPPQFDAAEPFRSGYAIVKYRGQDGILRMIDGQFAGHMEQQQLTVNDKVVPKACYQLTLPDELASQSIRLRIVDDANHELPYSQQMSIGSTRTFMFTPQLKGQETVHTYHIDVLSDGLLLWQDQAQLAFHHEVATAPAASRSSVSTTHNTHSSLPSPTTPKLRGPVFKAGQPHPLRKRADDDDNFPISVVVYNTGDSNGKVSLSLMVDGRKTATQQLSVKAGNSSRVTLTIKVDKERWANVRAVLSAGTPNESEILLKPNY